MILRELINTKRARNTERFFGLQAEESIRWLATRGVTASSHPKALDLGCGFGFFGHALAKVGFTATYSDDADIVHELIPRPYTFVQFDVCKDDYSKLGTYDLVVLSNVLEHLPDPERMLRSIPALLNPGGAFYICWTNWLSFYGGHEFTPYHYLGSRIATWLYRVLPEKLLIDGRNGPHELGKSLFPTYIGKTLRMLRSVEGIEIDDYVPRYYPEHRWIAHTPILREFLAWNFAVLVRKCR
jgi:arabinofuranan 3-O-arabinosyltransferase